MLECALTEVLIEGALAEDVALSMTALGVLDEDVLVVDVLLGSVGLVPAVDELLVVLIVVEDEKVMSWGDEEDEDERLEPEVAEDA